VPTTDFLKVVDAYSSEKNYTVWNDLTVNLAGLGLVLQYTDYYKSLGNFCLKLYEPIAAKLGWDAKEGEGEGVIGDTF
jgi:puromycin-sensitive aminopeptidase